jgi:hypothetical protein
MSKKRISGLIGIVVGGVWLMFNFQHFERQGFVAIGMPLLLLVLGVVYFIRGKNEEDE